MAPLLRCATSWIDVHFTPFNGKHGHALHSPQLVVITYPLRYSAMSTTLTSEPSGATVFGSFAQCIDSFGNFIVALSASDSRPTRLGQVDNESLLEEYGRLRIWGDQAKADFPARARGSLDDTLRHDNELKDMVLGILLRLKALLDTGIPPLIPIREPLLEDGPADRIIR